MMNACMEMSSVDLKYGARTIVNDINLKIISGKVVGIIGPNGSGKSTILKALCGLLTPAAGQIKLDGTELNKLSREAIARQIGVVPQAPLLPEGFTVLETVLMGRYPHLGLLRSEKKKDLDIAYHAMERASVQSLAYRRVGQISGGERQRVLIARVLAQEPRFLLLDEPTTHLDIQHQLEVMELVRSLANSGMGIAETIHDVSLAGRFCNNLILLKDRRIFKEGTPQEVITPDNIEQVFGVMAMVYGDLAAGLMVVNTSLARPRSFNGQKHVHIIGGGGSAIEIMQKLYIEGYRLTIGVLNQGDTDLSTALALGAEAVTVLPFAKIDEASHKRNMELAAQADCCLVADVPFGKGNLLNLKAVTAARRLILIDDRPIEQRDYTRGTAAELYSQLKARAFCTSITDLKEALGCVLSNEQVTNAK